MKARFKVLSTNPASPFSNLFALAYNYPSFLSGKVWIFLKATTTKPAFDNNNFLRKFLWISVIFLLSLNFSITYLILAILPFLRSPSSILRRAAFSLSFICCWILAILAAYLHLLKHSPIFPWRFLKSWRSAFSLSLVSHVSMKALSTTDLMAKLSVENTFETDLHSFISFVFSVIACHLLYIFFCPPIVVLINWMTDLFLKACPY